MRPVAAYALRAFSNVLLGTVAMWMVLLGGYLLGGFDTFSVAVGFATLGLTATTIVVVLLDHGVRRGRRPYRVVYMTKEAWDAVHPHRDDIGVFAP